MISLVRAGRQGEPKGVEALPVAGDRLTKVNLYADVSAGRRGDAADQSPGF
jgi:hypothetical protein